MSQFQIVVFSLILVLLILFAAFFSCAETAFMAVNRYRLRHKARLKKRHAIRLLQLLKRPDRLLGTILIGSTFANVLASSLATLIAYHFFGDNGAIFSAIILTFVILIFAEIAPKTLAAIYPDKFAQWIVYPIRFISRLLYPAVWLATVLTNSVFRLIGIPVQSYVSEPLSREELRSMVYDTTGKISRQYQNMLLSILDLSKLTVDDVMIPRNEILGVDIEKPWEENTEQIKKFHQDFIPVYRENINQVVGVFYARDMIKLWFTEHTMNKDAFQHILQEPYFIPAGTLLNIQLSYFQQNPVQVAFVVDEYGEIQGLLTLNDILEEIVGDFTKIARGSRIQQQADQSYLVDGAIAIREFNRLTDCELPLHGPRTLNGLIVEYLETLPNTGTCLLIAGYPIEIMQVQENRVKLARIFPRLPEKD